jgi:opine dehydrogenase
MSDKPTVAVCGCGSAGTAIAADLGLMGAKVNVFELREFERNIAPIREHGGVELTGTTSSGKNGVARFNRVTTEPQEALEGAELIMITVPAQAHAKFFETLAPHLLPGQTILVNTGYWASLRMRETLRKHGKLGKVTLAEENIMPYLSRVIAPAHAHIYNYKRDLRLSAWPATKNGDALKLVRTVYPQFSATQNVIENNFFPGNPAVHAQINIPKAEFFFERAREFRFYGEVSMCASRLVDASDRERIRVAEALGCQVPGALEYFRTAYQYPGENFYEMYGPTCEHSKRWGTDAGNRRVLQEDLCYFMVPMEQIAKRLNVAVPVTQAMIELLQIFAETDYRTGGVTLADLGLEGCKTAREMLDYATYGELGR